MISVHAYLNSPMYGCRAVRMAFWDYTKGAALTGPCDEDVDSICVQTKRTKGVFSIGYVGRCLSKQLASRQHLAGACRKLVTVAAPKDVREYLQVRAALLPCSSPDQCFMWNRGYLDLGVSGYACIARRCIEFIDLLMCAGSAQP